MQVVGTKRLDDARVQYVVRELNAFMASWSALNSYWAKSAFISIRWNGREYVGKLQYTSNQGTSTVHVVYSK